MPNATTNFGKGNLRARLRWFPSRFRGGPRYAHPRRAALVMLAAVFFGCAGPDISDMGPFKCEPGLILPGDSYLVSWECGTSDCAPSSWEKYEFMEIFERGGELFVVFNGAKEIPASKIHIFPYIPEYFCLVTEVGLTICPDENFVVGTVTDDGGAGKWLMRGCLLSSQEY